MVIYQKVIHLQIITKMLRKGNKRIRSLTEIGRQQAIFMTRIKKRGYDIIYPDLANSYKNNEEGN